MDHWLCPQSRAASLLSNLYCIIARSELKQKIMISPSVFVVPNSEQYHSHIFGLYSFPTALPPCRHQHSLGVHVCIMKCLHACTYKYCTHNPMSKLHEGITMLLCGKKINQLVLEYDICTSEQSPLVVVITKCYKSK